MFTRTFPKSLGSALALLSALTANSLAQNPAVSTNVGPAKWEAEIKAFEAADKTNPPPRNATLFVGSSSVRLWKTLARDDFKRFAQKIHAALPRTRIAFISIKPSPARWHLVEKTKAANQMIEDFCRQDKRRIYIDVFNPMLGPDGQPRADLFVEDKLHMNPGGYALWSALIKPWLRK